MENENKACHYLLLCVWPKDFPLSRSHRERLGRFVPLPSLSHSGLDRLPQSIVCVRLESPSSKNERNGGDDDDDDLGKFLLSMVDDGHEEEPKKNA